jgi:hypothetical protein
MECQGRRARPIFMSDRGFPRRIYVVAAVILIVMPTTSILVMWVIVIVRARGFRRELGH